MKRCPKCQESAVEAIGGRHYCADCLARGTDRVLRDLFGAAGHDRTRVARRLLGHGRVLG